MMQEHNASAGDDAIERHMTTREVAKLTGKSEGLIRKIVARRDIEHVRIGTSISIPESALRKYLERNRVPARERTGT